MGCFRRASIRLFDRGASSDSMSGHQKHSDASGLVDSGSGLTDESGSRRIGMELCSASPFGPPASLNIQRAARRLRVDVSLLRISFERHRP